MSGFFGRNSKADTGNTRLAGMKVQTTTLGRCIPWLFGTNRVAPNIIQYDDFQAIERKEKQGGKGGGGTSTSYEYKAAVILAICRGPILGVPRIWADKKKWTPSTLGLDIYPGSSTQTPHPHWQVNHPATALAYRGLAYAAKASMDLGSGGSVERHTFEVQTPSAISLANPDARIDTVISSILTDKIDGVGIWAGKVGDLTQLVNFTGANGIFISPVYEDQRPAKDVLARLAEIAQCGMFWGDGRLKFVPYSDTEAKGNGYTYTPASSTIYELTVDDFLPDGDGPPIKTRRKGNEGAKNHIQIKFSDRANEYNAATVESKDLGSIERFGLLSADPDEFNEICVARVAQALADFRRDRAGAVRMTFSFRLSLRWDRLEPMDVVALTYAPDGYYQYTVRILSIEEVDDELIVEAEDCPLGAQHVVTASPQTPIGGGVDYNIAPGNASTPVMFEPPLSMTDGIPEIWIATSGGPLWGGAEMHISTDGSTYQRVADVPARARHGVLTAALPVSASMIDTAHTASVSLAVSSGSLSSGTTQDALDLNTLCWVDGEYIAYRDATLTGANAYNLGYLVRGQKGSAIAAHAAGGKVVRLDDGVVRYPYDRAFVGRTIWVKFTSRNIFDAGYESLANVVAHGYTITGSALAGDVPASGNMLFNADFALQFRGWTSGAAGIAAVRGLNLPGWTLAALSPVSGDTLSLRQIGVAGNPTAYWEELSDPIPVEPEDLVCAAAYTGAHRCKTAVFAYYYNATGNVVGNSYGANSENVAEKAGGASLSDYKRCFGIFPAPATARTARLVLRKYDTGPGGADSWLFACRAQLGTVPVGTTEPPGWGAGPIGYQGDLNATHGAPEGTDVAGRDAVALLQDVDNAAATAVAAAAAATAAQGAADDAAEEVAAILDDGILSIDEKRGESLRWSALANAGADNLAKAAVYGLSTAAYTAAIDDLEAYLTGLVPAWDDATQHTPINAGVYRARWTAALQQQVLLLNRIAEEAGKRATWSGTYGPGKPDDNATVGAVFGPAGVGNVAGQIVPETLPQYVASNTLHESNSLSLAAALGTGVYSPTVGATSSGVCLVLVVGALNVGNEPNSSQSPTVGRLVLVVNGAVVGYSVQSIGAAGSSGVTWANAITSWSSVVNGSVTAYVYAQRMSGSQAVQITAGTTVSVIALKE